MAEEVILTKNKPQKPKLQNPKIKTKRKDHSMKNSTLLTPLIPPALFSPATSFVRENKPVPAVRRQENIVRLTLSRRHPGDTVTNGHKTLTELWTTYSSEGMSNGEFDKRSRSLHWQRQASLNALLITFATVIAALAAPEQYKFLPAWVAIAVVVVSVIGVWIFRSLIDYQLEQLRAEALRPFARDVSYLRENIEMVQPRWSAKGKIEDDLVWAAKTKFGDLLKEVEHDLVYLLACQMLEHRICTGHAHNDDEWRETVRSFVRHRMSMLRHAFEPFGGAHFCEVTAYFEAAQKMMAECQELEFVE